MAGERRRQILERARAAGRIAVTEIAEELDDAATVYLDDGFTPSLVADELIKMKPESTVVT